MRVDTSSQLNQVKYHLTQPAQRLDRLYAQLISGQRLSRLSDDPTATLRVVEYRARIEEMQGRQALGQAATRRLGPTDTQLGEISIALSRCRELTLRAMSNQLSDNERVVLAQEVRHISQNLVRLGNERIGGDYLFAGTHNASAPLQANTMSTPPILYHGGYEPLRYQLSPDDRLTVSVTGAEVFNFTDPSGNRPATGVDADIFSLLNDLAASMENNDQDSLNRLQSQVEASHTHVVGLRGRIGLLTQRAENIITSAEDAEVRLGQFLSAEQDLDYAEAITDLRSQETVYRVVLEMTSRMMEVPSLFEMSW